MNAMNIKEENTELQLPITLHDVLFKKIDGKEQNR